MRVPILTTQPAAASPAPPTGHHHHHGGLATSAISRRRFVAGAAGATGAILGSGLWWPTVARAADGGSKAPKPIPGGIDAGGEIFHVFIPGSGQEPATITDFKGWVGVATVGGTGTGTNLSTGETTDLVFDTDMRFMQGVYVDTGGHQRHGTFGFV